MSAEAVKRLEIIKTILDDGRKWSQGMFYDQDTGKRCIAAAFAKSAEQLPEGSHEAWFSLQHACGQNPVDFNDRLGTRWSDMKEAIDKAIELCKAGTYEP